MTISIDSELRFIIGGQSEREDKVSLDLTEEILQSMEVGMAFRDYNGRISSMDFHRTSNFLVTASDDESIRLYDVANATCLKTINSKKYGVDLVCFTSHPTTVIYSSKNGWAYDDQGLVFAIAFGGYIRMFDARKYEKGPFDIFSVGGDVSDANVVKFSNDGRLVLLTTAERHIHVLDSFHGTLLFTFNVKPVLSNSTLEASFSTEGTFVISVLDANGPPGLPSLLGGASEVVVITTISALSFSPDTEILLRE